MATTLMLAIMLIKAHTLVAHALPTLHAFVTVSPVPRPSSLD